LKARHVGSRAKRVMRDKVNIRINDITQRAAKVRIAPRTLRY
jgi:hypothetical protein